MVEKVNIIADYISFLKLLTSNEFVYGRDLKCLLRNRARVHLIADEEQIQKDWNDVESLLRKSCDAYDIPCPQVNSELGIILTKPELSFQIDPFAIWIINTSDENIGRFRDDFGVWMENADNIKDDTFYLHHKKSYSKDQVILGKSNNGWKNFLDEITAVKTLPPMNSIVINDRYIMNNGNEYNAERIGFYGLENLVKLMEAILPTRLRIPFHLFIFCQHPQLRVTVTDEIVKRFKNQVQAMRDYPILIEFIYDKSEHKRTLHSNYFHFNVDRTYNAFYITDFTKLCGANDFYVESYHNDPQCSGNTNYITDRNDLQTIKSHCDHVINKPRNDIDFEKVARADINGEQFIQNRLFS